MLKLMRGLIVAVALLAPLPALAQSPTAEFDKKLTKYDPAAVKAALHYMEIFNTKSFFAQSMPSMRDMVVKIVKERNPSVDAATMKEFAEVVLKVVYVDNVEFFEKFTLVTMLDIFTAEEIIALDNFYSSDAGRSVLKKMPQMMTRMPQMMEIMMKQIMPQALQEAQKALKAKGKDIRI